MREEVPEWAEEVLPPKEGSPCDEGFGSGVQKFQGVRCGSCPSASCGGSTRSGDK